MAISITVEQKVLLDANPVSASGYAAEVEPGSWSWYVHGASPEGVVEIFPEADKCWVVPTTQATGKVKICAQADADLGPSTGYILGEFEVTVTGAQASHMTIGAGTPVPRDWQPE